MYVKGLRKRLRDTVEGEIRFDPGSPRPLRAGRVELLPRAAWPRASAQRRGRRRDPRRLQGVRRARRVPDRLALRWPGRTRQRGGRPRLLQVHAPDRRHRPGEPRRARRARSRVLRADGSGQAAPLDLGAEASDAQPLRLRRDAPEQLRRDENAQYSGIAVHNVEALDVILYDGTSMHLGWMTASDLDEAIARGDRAAAVLRGLRDFRDRLRHAHPRPLSPAAVARVGLQPGRAPRPGKIRAIQPGAIFVGTEGTCATIVEATIRRLHLSSGARPRHHRLRRRVPCGRRRAGESRLSSSSDGRRGDGSGLYHHINKDGPAQRQVPRRRARGARPALVQIASHSAAESRARGERLAVVVRARAVGREGHR